MKKSWLSVPGVLPVLCLLLGGLAILPLAVGRHTVLIQDMLLAYYCYFADFHRDFAWNHLPLWSSSYQAGMPMHAYWQSGWLYPGTWLCFGPFPPQYGLYLFYAMHFGVAAYGFTALGPRLGLTRLASVWAGAVFALSGTLLARYEHPTFLAGWAYMPWVLGLFLHAQRRPSAPSMAGYALVFALQAYGGHPQATITTALLLLPFTLWPRKRSGVRPPCSPVAAGLGAHALALALCLPLFLPFMRLVSETSRYAGSAWEKEHAGIAASPGAAIEGPGDPPVQAHPAPPITLSMTLPINAPVTSEESAFGYGEFIAGSLRPLHLLALAYPYALGSPAHASWWGQQPWTEVYTGLGGLALLLIAFASWRRANRDLRLLGLVGIAGLWLALGPLLFASAITFHLPILGDMRRPARYGILLILALAAFSGQGFRLFSSGRSLAPRPSPWIILSALHALGAAGLLALGASAHAWPRLLDLLGGSSAAQRHVPKLRTLSSDLGHDFIWMMAALALLAMALTLRRRFLPFFFLALVAGLLRLHWAHFHPFPSDFYRKPPATFAALDLPSKPFWRVNHYLEYPGDSLWLMHHDPTARMDLYEREKAALSYGIHAVYGVRHVSAHLPLMWHWGQTLTPGALSARYVLSDLPLERFQGSPLKHHSSYGSMRVYAVGDFAPRLERKPGTPRGPLDAKASALSALSTLSTFPACPADFAAHADLCAREPRDGRIFILGDFAAGDTLLFRERFWPGWQARFGNGPWLSMRKDAAGFAYAASQEPSQRVELRYHPAGFYALVLASGLVFALMVGTWHWWLWKPAKRGQAA